MKKQLYLSLAAVLALSATLQNASQAAEVVAFWGFADDYDFEGTGVGGANPSKINFAAEVNNTPGAANLQAYLGIPDELDPNGGGGSRAYTSPTSGITYAPTRTVKWDDLKGGGDSFDIGGVDTFMVDKLDGDGPLANDFGNDALMYITFDGTGFKDFEFRFDIEATPDDLADSFDVFYRVGGSGTWFRDPSQNNISLSFQDYDVVDPDNQFALSGQISLSSSLNNQASIELIINDFAENGNNEMEIDNFEIIGSAVPEPGSFACLAACTGLSLIVRRRKTR
ncbi:hypothetical protein Q31b_22750 [Novipirellula aureliae]|uniref:PEP-CTERM protein-sorting domain-containing protein n=1 Tax=Novipirellula aureliae TaxID=2527966 RepID=A0A5C6E5K5_9BACT|nr:hypothetical protein [Novipirellula aureliae]TWU43237.1 hypothetical protein Q31b_22750 [Novipirellula aureliae]